MGEWNKVGNLCNSKVRESERAQGKLLKRDTNYKIALNWWSFLKNNWFSD